VQRLLKHRSLTVISVVLALTAGLLSGLPPMTAGFAAAAIFIAAFPVLDALHERLQSLPATLCAAGLLLAALLGVLG
jgi:predicted PurR-regulated permease PerM